MDVTRIDQIAVVVEDLDAALAHYELFFGLKPDWRETIETSQIEEAMLNVGGVYLQLIQPTSPDSVVAQFLDVHGPGLHHIGFGVASLDQAIEHLRANGAVCGDARLGGGGHMIAFAEPAQQIGVLTELVQDEHAGI